MSYKKEKEKNERHYPCGPRMPSRLNIILFSFSFNFFLIETDILSFEHTHQQKQKEEEEEEYNMLFWFT